MFERKPLRADVGAEILGRIIDGQLPSGTRINESHLATELGISRTPLREAMLCLTTDGALNSDMGRGFRVPHLEGREITDLLGTLAILLPAAIRQSNEPDLKIRVEAGNLLGRARMNIDQPGVLCEQIYLLIRLLCRDCPNTVLRVECDRLIRLSLRYLFEAMTRGWNPEPTIAAAGAGLDDMQRNDRLAAADTFARALRNLGADLALHFPAEIAGKA